MILFGIEHAGFNNSLRCGTINFFDGWVVNLDKTNPITSVGFFVDDIQIGCIIIKGERPDLVKAFNESLLGFYGICDIPEKYINKSISLNALAKNGESFFMEKFELKEKLSQEEKDYRKNNALPNDTLMHLVVHNVDPKSFLEEGESGVETIKSILIKNDIDLLSMKNILDFGVGCGRVIRWWQEYSTKIDFWGCDINSDLVNWCSNNLDFGKYSINDLQPPSIYDNSQFDLIYLFSVFTHLAIDTQKKWLNEFSRILIPGGILLVSVHGDFHANNLPKECLEIYHKKGYYVLSKNAEGENLCASYQSREYCEKIFSEKFVILNHITEVFNTCGNQDLYVLKKR